MSTTMQSSAISLLARDLSGQNQVKVAGVSPDSTVGDLIADLVPKMKLGTVDGDGRRVSYQVRLEREGRHLHASERVGDTLMPGDQIVLQPNIMAGGS